MTTTTTAGGLLSRFTPLLLVQIAFVAVVVVALLIVVVKWEKVSGIFQRQNSGLTRERMSDATPPKEVKVKSRIKIRFTRVKKRLNDEGGTVLKRITLSKGSIPRKSVLIFRKTGLKPLPWSAHFVDHTQMDSYDELSFDENYCEPINPDTGEPEWSNELESILVAALHGQMIDVATRFWRFIFTRQHFAFALMGLIAGASITLGLGTVFHAFGGVQVNWTIHAPR